MLLAAMLVAIFSLSHFLASLSNYLFFFSLSLKFLLFLIFSFYHPLLFSSDLEIWNPKWWVVASHLCSVSENKGEYPTHSSGRCRLRPSVPQQLNMPAKLFCFPFGNYKRWNLAFMACIAMASPGPRFTSRAALCTATNLGAGAWMQQASLFLAHHCRRVFESANSKPLVLLSLQAASGLSRIPSKLLTGIKKPSCLLYLSVKMHRSMYKIINLL